MGKNIWDTTAEYLAKLAEKHRKVLVGYSDGKDSRAIMQLACRTFPEVIGYHLHYIPGLDCIEAGLDFARQRWQVEILQYPHPLFFEDLKTSPYSINGLWQDLPVFDTEDIVQSLMKDTGATLVVLGHKTRDGLHRKHQMARQYNDPRYAHIAFPIRDWSKAEVYGFLKANDIPLPEAYDDTSTSLNTSAACILWLYKKHREDYDKFIKFFPDASAVVAREAFYGLSVAER